MPADVPVLADVEVHELLIINDVEALLQMRVLNEVSHLCNGDIVHESAAVDCVVDAVLDVSAGLPSSL